MDVGSVPKNRWIMVGLPTTIMVFILPGSVRVDRMGIQVGDDEPERGAEIVSATIAIGNKPPFEAILSSYDRADMTAVAGDGDPRLH